MPSASQPAYARIAEVIRRRIQAGEIKPGETLEPLREAALTWGVNLHTARHAYTELAREGLVEMRRRRGTRVIATSAPPAEVSAESERFVESVLAEAWSRHRLSPDQLAARILERAGDSSTVVWVLECSASQSRDLAGQLEERFVLEASPLVLAETSSLPPGGGVATYFHYAEIRRRWPDRFADVHFVSIAPDPETLRQFPPPGPKGKRHRLDVCEWDEPTAGAVAADLSRVLDPKRYELRRRLVDDAGTALIGGGGHPVLFSPRVWDALSPEQRADPRAHQVRYLFDIEELERLSRELGWRPRVGLRSVVAGAERR